MSVISHSIVEHLLSADGPSKYGGDNRNIAVQVLAKDVQEATGLRANLMKTMQDINADEFENFKKPREW